MNVSTEMSFGEWLRRKRKAFDLTHEGLAQRVSCSTATIRKLESEERRPSAQIAERLAEIFDIPMDERDAFIRFARGDWRVTPMGNVENAPWLGSPSREQREPSHSITHLATFFFTDIEGSAKLWDQAPEKMKVALQRHHAILQEAITSNGGAVFQIVGDAFCAAFPTVQSAISAAVTAQRALYQAQWDLPFPIRVRMGIHTGEAEQTSDNPLLEGYASNQTLNRVARILSAAHGGQLLVSLSTKDLVKDLLPADIELRDMGEHHLKNLVHPEHLFQLSISGLPSEFPPLNTLTHRHNLPVQMTSFIGRENEQREVIDLLAKNRLVTLTGAGGIGKTRLSIGAAQMLLPDFSEGVFFIALAPLGDPNLIASVTAQALGYVGAKNISSTEQLKEGIGDKSLLLILDNCEHLIEAVASLAAELLSACSHLKILATSREVLRVPGEWLYKVPAFDLPTDRSSLNVESASRYPALTLFTERARAVHSDFSLNADNIDTVTAICARLDGLPLAIELIAARIRLMSPQMLLKRLSAQFILTADGMRTAPERQKTLNSAIDWSYNLLPPEEQKTFAYLSVFSGGFTLEAAEAIFSQNVTETPIFTLIASLLDKSLLTVVPDPEASNDTRHTMLVTIQEYARERLREMEEEAEIRNLHLVYFLNLAEKAGKELRGPNQLEWLRLLDSDRDNLRTALGWAIETGQTETALQMVRSLHWFWLILSNFNEGRQWFQRVLEMRDAPLYPGAYAEVLTQMAHQTFLQFSERDAKPYAEQALSIARTYQDKHNTARALVWLGLALIGEKNFTAAQSAFEESKRLFQEVHDEWGYSFVMMVHATLFWNQEDWATALYMSQQALKGFQKLGHRYFQNVTLRHIGIAYVNLSDLTNGRAALRESLLLAQQLNSKYDIAQVLMRFGEAAKRVNQHVRTVHLYWATRNISESIGTWQQEDAPWFEDELAPCRAALGESEFAAAIEQGRAMTMEQAIAYALEDQE
jgi:predicted ATPase/class 3 adenylate cyclase/DNA-binding XRE family transcriptional regulator